MKFKIVEIPVMDIDIENSLFRITTSSAKDITDSIKDLGLLSYPYLAKKNREYIIVSGFRRITSCISLGYTYVPAKIISDGVSKFECAKLAISENTLQRKLNIVEQSRCYRILKDVLEDIKITESLETSLGFLFSKSAIKKISPVCFLNWPIQEGLIEGYLSLPTALRMGKMKFFEADIFVKLFKHLNTSLNKQMEIIDFLMEICVKDSTTIKQLISSYPIREILNSSKNQAEKTNLIRSYLKELCYPIITATFKKFENKMKGIKLNKNVNLIPPKFFEGDIYELTVKFKSCSELEERKEDINKIIKTPDLLNCFQK